MELTKDLQDNLQTYLSIKDGYILSKISKYFNNIFNDRINRYFKDSKISDYKKEPDLIKYLTYLHVNDPKQELYYVSNNNYYCKKILSETCDYCTTLLNIYLDDYICINTKWILCDKKNVRMCITESIRQQCDLRNHPEFKDTCDTVYDACLKCNQNHELYYFNKNYYLCIFDKNSNLTRMKFLFSGDSMDYHTKNLYICNQCYKIAVQKYETKWKYRSPYTSYRIKKKDKIYIKNDNDEYTNTTLTNYLSNGNSYIEWEDF